MRKPSLTMRKDTMFPEEGHHVSGGRTLRPRRNATMDPARWKAELGSEKATPVFVEEKILGCQGIAVHKFTQLLMPGGGAGRLHG
jgi:hypothetical protein